MATIPSHPEQEFRLPTKEGECCFGMRPNIRWEKYPYNFPFYIWVNENSLSDTR